MRAAQNRSSRSIRFGSEADVSLRPERGDIRAMVESMTSVEHDRCEMALAMAKEAISS